MCHMRAHVVIYVWVLSVAWSTCLFLFSQSSYSFKRPPWFSFSWAIRFGKALQSPSTSNFSLMSAQQRRKRLAKSPEDSSHSRAGKVCAKRYLNQDTDVKQTPIPHLSVMVVVKPFEARAPSTMLLEAQSALFTLLSPSFTLYNFNSLNGIVSRSLIL